MDCVFGFVGKDYVLLVTDCNVARSIAKVKTDEDKVVLIDDNKALGLAGEAGERLHFGDFVQKNVHLLKYKHGKKLTTKQTSNFMRSQMAEALRKSPYHCQCVLAGWDEGDGATLYWIDYLATCQKVKTAAQGYCAYFLGGLFDNRWKENMTFDEGKTLVKDCIAELKKRFIVGPENYKIKLINHDGVKDISEQFGY